MKKSLGWISKLALVLGLTSALASTFLGCSTDSHHGEISYGDIPVPTGDYNVELDKWTQSEKTYTGGAQALQVTATLLSRNIVEGQNFMDAEKYHWTPEQYRDNRQKALYQSESSTTIFMSVYADNDENNLDTTSSAWNIFLDVRGKKILPSSIKRDREGRARIVDKYPYINVWSNNYLITFPSPTSDTTSGSSELTVAGPTGAVHLKFPK